jgi:flagellar biosynthetic protein FliQ
MTVETIYSLTQETLMKTMWIAGPILIIGMIADLLMGIFQSITSIQETTVAFVPKMLIVGAALVFLFPWMLSLMNEFTISILGNLAKYGQ